MTTQHTEIVERNGTYYVIDRETRRIHIRLDDLATAQAAQKNIEVTHYPITATVEIVHNCGCHMYRTLTASNSAELAYLVERMSRKACKECHARAEASW